MQGMVADQQSRGKRLRQKLGRGGQREDLETLQEGDRLITSDKEIKEKAKGY